MHLFGRYGITIFALSGIDIALWDLNAKRGRDAARAAPRRGLPPRRSFPGTRACSSTATPSWSRPRRARPSTRATPPSSSTRRASPRWPPLGRRWGRGRHSAWTRTAPGLPPRRGRWRRGSRPTTCTGSREPIFPPEDFDSLARLQRESGVDPRVRRERLHRLRVPGNARCGRGSLRAAERDQGGRGHRVPQGGSARRGAGGDRDAPLALLRSGLARDPSAPCRDASHGPPRGELDGALLYAARGDALPGLRLPVEGGRFRVPSGPGLGAEPDPDVIRDYRVAD